MADKNRDLDYEDFDLRYSEQPGQKNDYGASDHDHLEETSAELAAPMTYDGTAMDRRTPEIGRNYGGSYQEARDTRDETDGRGVGYIGLALSILSLFVFPVLLGAAGIIVGFIARRRGAGSLGGWAIGIGVVSILLGMFVRPYF